MSGLKGFDLLTSPRRRLVEGGNATAVDRATGNPMVFAGREARADKVDLRRVPRANFRSDFVRALQSLDDIHEEKTGEPIWDPRTRDRLLTSGHAFNGSSEHLFGPRSDEEFVSKKPIVGDIDLTIPEEKLESLYTVLASLEGRRISDKVAYVGQKHEKMPALMPQINAIFAYDIGDGDFLFVQVDFEGVEYNEEGPDDFSKFGHSSPWEDLSEGLKGLCHKFLVRSLVAETSKRPDAVLVTPKRGTPVKSSVPFTTRSFSVDKGVRDKVRQRLDPQGNPVMVGDKLAFTEIPPAESTYTRVTPRIYEFIFGAPPTPSEATLFRSYVGLLDLMKKKLKPDVIEGVYLRIAGEYMFSRSSQGLDADNPENDRSVKNAALDKYKEVFPDLRRHDDYVAELQKTFYSTYKVRPPAGG